MPSIEVTTEREMISRREAVLRVTALLGGVALVGGSALLTACGEQQPNNVNPEGPFTAEDIAFLDEVADTILPPTSTPGAKAAKTGAFMALMVTDAYDAKNREIFRKGMSTLDAATLKANSVSFMKATPAQRLAVLEVIDRDQKSYSDGLRKAQHTKSMAWLSDQRKEAGPGSATAITENPPAHYFRMMKELALLGYFTSEIGCTQAQRYVETPGRYDPCVPYKPGEKGWAPHA